MKKHECRDIHLSTCGCCGCCEMGIEMGGVQVGSIINWGPKPLFNWEWTKNLGLDFLRKLRQPEVYDMEVTWEGVTHTYSGTLEECIREAHKILDPQNSH